MITITRTPDAGTLAEGVGRRAVAATMLRRSGFVWNDDLACWTMLSPAPKAKTGPDIEATAQYLRSGGHQVRVVPPRRDG
jgi:hypothetical protein